VTIQHLARREFLRGLQGLSDEDARKRIEPMNCISWIVGHVALQQHVFFVAWPDGTETEPRYDAFHTGSPPSEPPMEEVIALWQASCDDADVWLDVATEDSLRQMLAAPAAVENGENAGTLLVRNIFHTWCHLGEISSLRQMLGHRAPEFVNMYGWSYGSDEPDA